MKRIKKHLTISVLVLISLILSYTFILPYFKLAELKQRTLDELIFVKQGEFMMGDFDLEIIKADGVKEMRNTMISKDSSPAHLVRLDSYYMQPYEITNADYDLYASMIGISPRRDFGSKIRQPNYAAELFWGEVSDYCQWLGEQLEITMTIPTEAQWEFAARSRGHNVVFATDWGTVIPYQNINKDIRTDGKRIELNVYTDYPPNPLGFYDMNNNLNEWVSDWYDENYYKNSPIDNPKGPVAGKIRVARGGNQYGSLNYRITVFRHQAKLNKVRKKQSSGARRILTTPSYYKAYTGGRCLVNNTVPPAKSGFGVLAGKIPEGFPRQLSWVPLHGKNPMFNGTMEFVNGRYYKKGTYEVINGKWYLKGSHKAKEEKEKQGSKLLN